MVPDTQWEHDKPGWKKTEGSMDEWLSDAEALYLCLKQCRKWVMSEFSKSPLEFRWGELGGWTRQWVEEENGQGLSWSQHGPRAVQNCIVHLTLLPLIPMPKRTIISNPKKQMNILILNPAYPSLPSAHPIHSLTLFSWERKDCRKFSNPLSYTPTTWEMISLEKRVKRPNLNLERRPSERNHDLISSISI